MLANWCVLFCFDWWILLWSLWVLLVLILIWFVVLPVGFNVKLLLSINPRIDNCLLSVVTIIALLGGLSDCLFTTWGYSHIPHLSWAILWFLIQSLTNAFHFANFINFNASPILCGYSFNRIFNFNSSCSPRLLLSRLLLLSIFFIHYFLHLPFLLFFPSCLLYQTLTYLQTFIIQVLIVLSYWLSKDRSHIWDLW